MEIHQTDWGAPKIHGELQKLGFAVQFLYGCCRYPILRPIREARLAERGVDGDLQVHDIDCTVPVQINVSDRCARR